MRGWGGDERIAAERSESASQNSFLIPTSQKVAEPRVSSGAEVKTFGKKRAAAYGSGGELSVRRRTAFDPLQTFITAPAAVRVGCEADVRTGLLNVRAS